MEEKLIEVKNLQKYFQTPAGMLHAVDNVNFHVRKGETLGLVGESGCGKSTTGRAVLRLIEPTGGEILYEGEDICKYGKEKMREMRKKMQIVFQDPYSSLNPRHNVFECIEEPLKVNKIYRDRKETEQRVFELMETVGLAPRLVNAYPHELDGGRRQRVGVARALALNPSFLVLDEPVSALDVSIQAQVLNLLQELQRKFKLSYLFISHDLSVVKHISDRIAVMYLGVIVELAGYREIFGNPLHPYTRALLSAVPVPRLSVERERVILEGDVPSPVNPPAGCRFCKRCPNRREICGEQTPEFREMEPGHFVACHFAGETGR